MACLKAVALLKDSAVSRFAVMVQDFRFGLTHSKNLFLSCTLGRVNQSEGGGRRCHLGTCR
jgi:hypothetical protein